MLASTTVQFESTSVASDSILARLTAPAAGVAPRPRIVALFAHPDDEVLAVGGRLEQFCGSRFLVATDGAPEDGVDARDHGFGSVADYRAVRQQELHAAFTHAGLAASHSAALLLDPAEWTSQVADKQTMKHLSAVTRALLRELHAFRPDAILTHPFEGGHPDHDSCAFAAHAAAALLGAGAPPIFEAPFYHAGLDGGMCTNTFLPSDSTVVTMSLSAAQQAVKRERLACFRSQQQTLSQFRLETEQLRIAPTYDFTLPPNGGRVFYESFGWGVTAAAFLRHVSIAVSELGLSREGKQLR